MIDTACFKLDSVSSGYGAHKVIKHLSLEIPNNQITTLIGPNGCGKSTLLKTICGLLPFDGDISFNGTSLNSVPRRQRAQELTMLPQAPIAPDGLTVAQLVGRGRHPYQNWFSQWSAADEVAVREAMEMTDTLKLANEPVNSLSGGQRQRVWISMVMAQDTNVLLLDEPTTYLDLARSVEILDLVRKLHEVQNKTIIMVLHDLNLAARISDQLVALHPDASIAATGTAYEVLQEDLLQDVFGLRAKVDISPTTGDPLVIPR